MGAEFTFYDYVDGTGRNVIHEWLIGTPNGVRAHFTNWLVHLEATKKGDWSRRFVDTLKDDCDGLFELRKSKSGIQFRILGSHHTWDKTPTLLNAFIKQGAAVPPIECTRAYDAIDDIDANPTHRVEHDFS